MMVSNKKSLNKAELARNVVSQLRDRLPAGWWLVQDREVGVADLRADLVLTLTGPDDSTARVVVELKRALDLTRATGVRH